MLALVFTALFAVQANQAAEKIDVHWVFVRNHLAWKSRPKSAERGYVYAEDAHLAIFYPSGKFALVSCVLNRNLKTGRYWISHGDGYSIKKGTWERNRDGSVIVKSRYVYMNVPFTGLPLPGPEVEERWTFRGRSKGRVTAVAQAPKGKPAKGIAAVSDSPAGQYVPLSNLESLDFLSNIVALSGRN